MRPQFCQLPCCNLFNHRVYLLEIVICGPRSYFPTLFTTVLIAFHHHLLARHISLSSYFTSAHLILCVQQAGEIDNLSVSLGQSSLFVIVCRSTSTRQATTLFLALLIPSKPSPSPTGSITLVLKSRKTAALLHHTFLLEFPSKRVIHVIKLFF